MTNNNTEYHNVVDIIIFNNEQEVALQLRAANDKSFPSHWDFSAGGHIDENENHKDAAKRELFEELGVEGDLVFVSQEHFEYSAWNSSNMREVDAAVYLMRHNGPFKIESSELEKVTFFSLTAIQKMIDNGENFHPEFLFAWNKGIIRGAINHNFKV